MSQKLEIKVMLTGKKKHPVLYYVVDRNKNFLEPKHILFVTQSRLKAEQFITKR